MSVLVAAHLSTALVMVLVLHQAGQLMAGMVARPGRTAAAIVLAVIAAAVDVTAVVRGRMTAGLHRQTPKEVAHDPNRPWWVTPLVWGGDTGLVWTTFRVSSASWMLLVAALLGVAPWWAGVVYGLAFAVPLTFVVRLGEGAPVCQVRPRLGRATTRAIQLVGVVALLMPLALTQLGS